MAAWWPACSVGLSRRWRWGGAVGGQEDVAPRGTLDVAWRPCGQARGAGGRSVSPQPGRAWCRQGLIASREPHKANGRGAVHRPRAARGAWPPGLQRRALPVCQGFGAAAPCPLPGGARRIWYKGVGEPVGVKPWCGGGRGPLRRPDGMWVPRLWMDVPWMRGASLGRWPAGRLSQDASLAKRHSHRMIRQVASIARTPRAQRARCRGGERCPEGTRDMATGWGGMAFIWLDAGMSSSVMERQGPPAPRCCVSGSRAVR